jgi:crotonobetainyl-CoA:carnitine CoA-transferase CaiB-like acyl-CoA transferase
MSTFPAAGELTSPVFYGKTFKAMNRKPLEGVRVLDLSRLLPGPYATLLLADLGAEVIKVEDTGGGDYIRAMAPFIGGQSAYFLALNPGKKSFALNLKAGRGREVFLRLAATAKIILEGFRPGTVDRLGIGFEDVKAVNPGIVYCSISGYGQDGPLRDRAGHDLNYIARAGILGLSGPAADAPAIPPVQIADLSSGMYAAVGMLAGLRESERTGEGRYLDIGMMDSALSWLIMTVAEFAAGERGRRGRLHLTGKFPCYHVYRTKDGHEITLAALETKFWTDFCRVAERPDLLDLQYSEDPAAVAEVAAVFASRTREEWAALARAGDFCTEPVQTLEEALSDVQVRRRGLVRLTHAGKEPGIELGNPLRRLEPAPPGPCPEHGEHTLELLRGLGYSDEELAGLEAAGVIRARRP